MSVWEESVGCFCNLFCICAALDLSTPLRYGRNDRGLGEWSSPRLLFRPEKPLGFGAEKFFYCFGVALRLVEIRLGWRNGYLVVFRGIWLSLILLWENRDRSWKKYSHLYLVGAFSSEYRGYYYFLNFKVFSSALLVWLLFNF